MYLVEACLSRNIRTSDLAFPSTAASPQPYCLTLYVDLVLAHEGSEI